jgi:lipoprotein-releasing system permease protein
MRVSRWIGFVAFRYIVKNRRRRSSPSPVLAVLEIAVGVLALIVIIAVMNGFQFGYIESILEISSYHIRIEDFAFPVEEKTEPLRALPGVTSAVPFRELKGLVRGKRGGQQVAVIRGLMPDTLEQDGGMAAKLAFEEGSFDLGGDNAVILGAEFARTLQVHLGDEVSLISISGLFSGEDEKEAENTSFIVTGVFRSGSYESDLGWAFINLDRAMELEGGDRCSLGIKLANYWQDERALERIRALPGAAAWTLSSWREYNRAFFGALRTEKLLMFVLVGLIFIVVGLNIFQSQRRTVLERREEIGLLRAVGATDTAVRLVFTCDGFLIGITGAVLGLGAGLLIATHISGFFYILETAVNGILAVINLAMGGGTEEFAVFSPAVFYIRGIPSRVIPREVLLIFMFGLLSAVLAAWFASGRVSRIRPAEVLRYE